MKLSLTIWTITAIALVSWITYTALNTPVVTLSHNTYTRADYLSDGHASSDELERISCVKVEPVGTCNDLPKKFTIIWSK